MQPFTIGIIGKISVGKSTIAKALSKSLEIPYTSFGAYLVQYSRTKGLPLDRKSLQDLGANFIKTDPRLFLEDVIQQGSISTNKIIIEGIRHLVILNEIKNLSKYSFSVYIDGSAGVRYNRFLCRHKENDPELTFEQFIEKDNHPVELEIDSLKTHSDLVIDSESLDVTNTIKTILAHLRV